MAARAGWDPGIEGLEGFELIGAGGFGTVYKAHQPALDRWVAVKILSNVLVSEDEQRRFDRERVATGGLSGHPHITTVHSHGLTSEGRPYIVMELCARSLADRVAAEGPLPWADVGGLGVQLAGALETAHRRGVLHRDLKPENVLLRSYGEPALADFGIARIPGATETRSGVVTASLTHAPPEILDGGRPSAASDVYSLTSTLWTALQGAPPFARADDEGLPALIARIATAAPPDLRALGVPEPVVAVLEQGLAKAPADRQASAAELGEALREAQRSLGVPAATMVVLEPGAGASAGRDAAGQATATRARPLEERAAAPTDPLPVAPTRRRALVPAVIVALLVLGGGVAAAAMLRGGDPPVVVADGDEDGGDPLAGASPSDPAESPTPTPASTPTSSPSPTASETATGAGPDAPSESPGATAGAGSGSGSETTTGSGTDSQTTTTPTTRPTTSTSPTPPPSPSPSPSPTQAPNEPPTASYTTVVAAGTTAVTFDASGSSDPDGDALAYTWTFNDGSGTKSGTKVTHSFTSDAQSGSDVWRVTLTVTDPEGESHSVSAPAQITMPRLTDMDGKLAHRAARGAGLTTFYSPAWNSATSFTEWATWSQWPAAGTTLPAGANVRLVIWDRETCGDGPDTHDHWWCNEPPPPRPTLDRSYF